MSDPKVSIDSLPEQTLIVETDMLVAQSAGITKKISVGTMRSGAIGTPGPPGPPGPPGIEISATPPAEHDILWADTTIDEVTGAPETLQVFVYTDEADARPSATVVFWIPNPYDLPDPYGAIPGDLVLRSTPSLIAGLNGLAKMWIGTATELAALAPAMDTVYFVYEPEAP
jgi:hypothetical protein